MKITDKMELTVILALCQLLHLNSAHRSSGRLIIDTAKQAFENAARRHRRDTSNAERSSKVNLESLLLPDPTNAHIVEFDVILDEDQFGTIDLLGENGKPVENHSGRQKRKAVRHSIYHWPGAEVPYKIHSSVDSISKDARYRIQKAMTHWERHSCVKFVEYIPYKHINYVTIQKGQWCASKLGMAGGAQPLYLAFGCLDTGTIIHELGHTLGWVHEQARPDRDDYVSINWGLVSASYKSQYIKHGTDFVNTYGIPYDYGSIMHYPSYGELITKDTSAQHKIGQRNRLSFSDIKLANAMYKCPERANCDTYSFECINGGFVDHTCKCVCPDGDHKSCTVSNNILEPYPKIKPETTTTKIEVCDPWTVHDNAYIPGYNEDIGFSLSIEECKTRCMEEETFNCQSFDYWKARRQCYLSSSTAAGLGIRLRRDSRMVHYILNKCLPTKPSIFVSITDRRKTTQKLPPSYLRTTQRPIVHPTTQTRSLCPFEYINTGTNCVRAISFPVRPVHIAEMDCKQKLGARIWTMDEKELQANSLLSEIDEGQEFWVRMKNFQSKNPMARFFNFCPYITKENGKIVLKDTLCYKSKGFFCQFKIHSSN